DDLGRKKVFAPKAIAVGSGAPNVVISFSPTSGIGISTVVSFNSSSTTTVGGATIVSYSWDFGDPTSGASNTSTAANPNHTFASSGTHVVTLSVTDSQGRTGRASVNVSVS